MIYLHFCVHLECNSLFINRSEKYFEQRSRKIPQHTLYVKYTFSINLRLIIEYKRSYE
jgi:hypothetical protein